MVKGLLVINLYLWNNCSSLSLQTAERRVKPGFYGKTYRCYGSCKNIISYQTCFYSRPLNNLRHQVFHHKRKQREIGHIIEPLFCQQTKCYLVTNQVKNQVCSHGRAKQSQNLCRLSLSFITVVHSIPILWPGILDGNRIFMNFWSSEHSYDPPGGGWRNRHSFSRVLC